MPDNEKPGQALEGTVVPAGSPPCVFSRRRPQLGTARGIRRELAALYGKMMSGAVTTDQARTGGFLLRCMLESLRLDEIEQRLTALESQKHDD